MKRDFFILSTEQKQFYSDNGYLIVPDFVAPIICDFLVSHATQLIEAFNMEEIKTLFSTVNNHHVKENYFLSSGNKIHFFIEENAIDQAGNLTVAKQNAINKIGHALHTLDPVFHLFSHSKSIAMLLADLNLAESTFLQSMYICKQPKIGGEVVPHQDSSFLYTKNQTLTGLWFALQDATLENGCLWGIPGAHRSPLKVRMKRNATDEVFFETYDNTPWSMNQMIPLPVTKGSLVVLHGSFPHMSYANQSNISRHAYTLHAMSQHDTFDQENWLR